MATDTTENEEYEKEFQERYRETRQKFSKTPECSKCGNIKVLVTYHYPPDLWRIEGCSVRASCDGWVRADMLPEHLCCSCKMCGYRWAMYCKPELEEVVEQVSE